MPCLHRKRLLGFPHRPLPGWLVLAVLSALGLPALAESPPAQSGIVTYEEFGAVGDGETDDLPAIVAAHAHANELDLPVRSRPDAIYHLGVRALTAIIRTDTDWGTSRFIIDDSRGVENHKRPLFQVRSGLEPEPIVIERLKRGQERLDLQPAHDLLVLVENANRKVFIRKGLNANQGTPQREVFILRRNGSIEGAIDWDYETVTRVEARPIDSRPLVIRGGDFTHIANQMKQEVGYNYWARNIEINRANTIIDGITVRVTGEGEFGHPYNGFLRAWQTAGITFRNCRIDARKTYSTIGDTGRPVNMGTYGYRADMVVDFRMLNCRMDDIHDSSRWGVATTNFMKNVLIEDCVLSRMDVHMGVSGGYVIRRCTLGHQGLKAIGRGLLLVEDSTVHAGSLIDFRGDYGSNWDGEVIVRNSRWIPPARTKGRPVMFNANNDGTHDFGYPCSMPRSIRIEGLYVDDRATLASADPGVFFFGDTIGHADGSRPHPYRLTERLEVHDLKTASGIPPSISPNPELTNALGPLLHQGGEPGDGLGF